MARSGGTGPLTLVHNRPVVTLDGGVQALVDTAGSALLLSTALAESRGLAIIESVVGARGETFTVLEPPSLVIGGYELDVDGVPAYGFDDTRALGLAASGLSLLLPASVLARHSCRLDCVGGEAWFGPPGADEARVGVRLRGSMSSSPGDGGAPRFAVSCSVGGVAGDDDDAPLSLLLDTGVSCSLVSATVAQSWLASTPSSSPLPSSAACVGPGNMAGLPIEARTPMVWPSAVLVGGEFTVPDVAFVLRADADVSPFDGSLGGNVLRSFALGLDLARGEVWLEQRAVAGGVGDADQVGVTVLLGDSVDADGAVGAVGPWTIGSVLTGLSPSVQVGDELVSVDGRSVEGLPIDAVLALLSGSPGVDRRHLVLRRDGSSLVEADAPVVRVL